MFSHSWPQMWVTAGTTGLDTSYVDAGELIDIIYEPITWLTLIQNDMLWSAFRCGRWHSRHDCHDGRKVLIRNQRMREEPDIDERWARTAASSGHRPAGVRVTRHQRAAVFFIDDDATHTYKHRYTQRLWSDVSHTHTHSRLTQSLKSLVLCCYQKKKNQDDTTLCAVKTKKWDEKNWSIIYRFSLTQCRILDEGLLTQENQHSLHTSSSSFSHEKSKSETF